MFENRARWIEACAALEKYKIPSKKWDGLSKFLRKEIAGIQRNQ